VIKKTLDSAGHVADADHDYRFLIPFQLTDCNNNIERITLDALGRTQVRSWWGNHPRLSVLIAALLADNERLPPHHASITADRYFNDDQQQLGQQVIFYDGSGSVL